MNGNVDVASPLENLNRWDMVKPTEANGFCIFSQELEEHPLVFFHTTSKQNFNSIASSGFLSAAALEGGKLTSVSYARRSSTCLAYLGDVVMLDQVIFAVKFESLQQDGIVINLTDIHVYKSNLQPRILGYCEVPKGFRPGAYD